ncbi:hypothetical protein B0J13DRAFT_567060 [Dactylonectria estremocensis]|uniref:SRPBCC domain-containing protein n=1 Tax=Dactylonectria estremocensis TaxID=1079267 RepID=A0A9P9DN01_9HYPO|nr:hypothetical protein B0J13DRAFT_567060 [Dactylonectria estremocensis]
MPLSVLAQIEISAPPATVRSTFFNFAAYQEWHKSWKIEHVQVKDAASGLQTGDLLKVNMQGMVFHPIVEENTAECFIWGGSLYGLLVARHEFHFSPSKENPGGTTFIQSEEFQGPLTIFFWPWRNKEFKSANWEAFNANLKKEAERSFAQI